MERFFIVTDQSKLYAEHFNHKENSEKIRLAFIEFSEQFGIQAKEYIPSNKQLGIVPTPADKEKFQTQLCKSSSPCKIFKLKSQVGMAWVELFNLKDCALYRLRGCWHISGATENYDLACLI